MTVVVVVVMVLLILIMLILVASYISVVVVVVVVGVVVVVDNTKWFDGDVTMTITHNHLGSECWTFYPQILSDHASILMLLVYLT